MHYMKAALRSLTGSRAARRDRKQAYALARSPLVGLDALASRAPSDSAKDRPIFIFSAGWRSGSTLLQRLICSDQETLLWGEPYDLCEIIQTLARLPRPVTQEWPPDEFFLHNGSSDNLASDWIANLYPSLPDLRDSLRAMVWRLLAEPAHASGAARWGLKEVRFGIEEAVFLHWLFPDAKFLMISRDVDDAFRSYQNFSSAMNWYAKWPSGPAFTPFAFARHRQHILNQFPQIAERTGGMIISYEDLTQGITNVDEIAQYCGLKIDGGILDHRVQGPKETTILTEKRLSWLDRTLLRAGTTYANHSNRANRWQGAD
ncbi:MAG: sulfotransferase [Sulfitobacter sp.]